MPDVKLKSNTKSTSRMNNVCAERQYKSISMCSYVASNEDASKMSVPYINNAPLAKPESFSDIYAPVCRIDVTRGDLDEQSGHSLSISNGNVYEKLVHRENYQLESETGKHAIQNLSANEDLYYDDSINLKNPIFNLQLEKLQDKYAKSNNHRHLQRQDDEDYDESDEHQAVKSSVVWWPYSQDVESSSSNFQIENHSKSEQI